MMPSVPTRRMSTILGPAKRNEPCHFVKFDHVLQGQRSARCCCSPGRYKEVGSRVARLTPHSALLPEVISQNVFSKPFCISQFSHKFVTSFFMLVRVLVKLTDLWGN